MWIVSLSNSKPNLTLYPNTLTTKTPLKLHASKIFYSVLLYMERRFGWRNRLLNYRTVKYLSVSFGRVFYRCDTGELSSVTVNFWRNDEMHWYFPWNIRPQTHLNRKWTPEVCLWEIDPRRSGFALGVDSRFVWSKDDLLPLRDALVYVGLDSVTSWVHCSSVLPMDVLSVVCDCKIFLLFRIVVVVRRGFVLKRKLEVLTK